MIRINWIVGYAGIVGENPFAKKGYSPDPFPKSFINISMIYGAYSTCPKLARSARCYKRMKFSLPSPAGKVAPKAKRRILVGAVSNAAVYSRSDPERSVAIQFSLN